MKYVRRLPHESDIGKLFFVKFDDGKYSSIYIKEVRKDEQTGELYLCKESSVGWKEQSYGTPVSLYNPKYTFMAGPLHLPDDFRVDRV
jgi:hypothetical protein